MSRKDKKGKRFEFLVSRTDEALEEGYYMEAIALTYALMEERTYRLLNRLGIRYGSRDKIAQCISYLRDSIVQKNISVVVGKMGTDALCDWLNQEFLSSGLLDDIDAWRKRRNDAIHDLAKGSIQYADMETIAEDGRKYFREYTAVIMRLKKLF